MDLSTATTDELLDELIVRHDKMVFLGRPLVNRDFDWQIRTKGDHYEVMGLLALGQARIGATSLGLKVEGVDVARPNDG
jgi:hypothetical protein